MPSSHRTIRMIAIVSSIAVFLHQCIADAMRATRLLARRRLTFLMLGCNMGATRGRAGSLSSWLAAALFLPVFCLSGVHADAQEVEAPSEERTESSRAVSTLSFLCGASAGLLAAE